MTTHNNLSRTNENFVSIIVELTKVNRKVAKSSQMIHGLKLCLCVIIFGY
jgi:hypothetical protein